MFDLTNNNHVRFYKEAVYEDEKYSPAFAMILLGMVNSRSSVCGERDYSSGMHQIIKSAIQIGLKFNRCDFKLIETGIRSTGRNVFLHNSFEGLYGHSVECRNTSAALSIEYAISRKPYMWPFISPVGKVKSTRLYVGFEFKHENLRLKVTSINDGDGRVIAYTPGYKHQGRETYNRFSGAEILRRRQVAFTHEDLKSLRGKRNDLAKAFAEQVVKAQKSTEERAEGCTCTFQATIAGEHWDDCEPCVIRQIPRFGRCRVHSQSDHVKELRR